MDRSTHEQRRAFSYWLRTGRWPRVRAADGRELKFNPYHDPRNGQFTFAPGGPHSLAHVIVSDRRGRATVSSSGSDTPQVIAETQGRRTNAVYDPGESSPRFQQVAGPRGGPPMQRGGNYQALQIPMTLEQVFPSLRNAPAGAIAAVVDNLLDFSGPSRALTAEITNELTDELIKQIEAVDPKFWFASGGAPQTLEGQVNQLNGLRFRLAVALFRSKGDARALQVETLRFVQARTNEAYDRGVMLLRAGRLRIHLSKELTLGNYIDREVRGELRRHYNLYAIDSAGAGPVRVNRREYVSSEPEQTYGQPDIRVDKVAFDVTLSPKSSKTLQVVRFFKGDFGPTQVVIIRPSQLGPNHTYVIQAPEVGR